MVSVLQTLLERIASCGRVAEDLLHDVEGVRCMQGRISMPADGICGAAEAGTKYRLHDRTMTGSKGKS